MVKPHPIKVFLLVSLLFGIFILASLPNLGKISFWPPDADKIAMDGVFVYDFIRDLPQSILHPYQYAIEYYARYPSLSVGQRPIFFPTVEAFFYGILGLNYTAPRVAVLLFLFVGMFFWVLLVTKTHDIKIGILSLVLWMSNPNIYILSQNILLEIPTLSMSILTLYLLHRYVSEPSGRMGIILGIVTGLTLWTNQKAAFLLPMFLLYPLCRKKLKLFMSGNTWLSAAIILIFLIPLAIISIWLGEHNIALSLQDHMAAKQTEIIHEGHSQLSVYLYFLYQDHFSLPFLVLAAMGMITAILTKDHNSILYGLTIFCVYLTFTIVSVKIPRYAVYWIPAFCFFIALAVSHMADDLTRKIKRGKAMILVVLLSLPVIYQLWTCFPIHIYHVSGYEAAARYVVERSRSPVLFFTGSGNGQFSFFVRKLDPQKHFLILRGQKMIATSLLHHDHHLNVYLHDQKEIYKALQQMGVQYVVVESPLHVPQVPAFKALMKVLRNPAKFTLEKTFSVTVRPSSRTSDYKLIIYRNLKPMPIRNNQPLTLHVPAAGKTLKITLSDMVEKKGH